MKQLCFLLLVLFSVKLQAQNDFKIHTADSILSSAVNSFPESKFYFIGQAHANQANTIVEKGLLFPLNNKFNVHYYILEFGQSLAFLLNRYLQTGEDSILNYINSNGNFSLVKTIKEFNDTVATSKSIKFFGLDFEDRLNGKWTKKAISIISDESKIPVDDSLQILLNAVINAKPDAEKESLVSLKKYLDKNEQSCRLLLGKYYVDVLLISNAQFKMSRQRDKAMFANFKLLYHELSKEEENPKFFASFGFGHVNPRNKTGLSYKLLETKESPVKGKIAVIGIEYFNCRFNTLQTPKKLSNGTLDFLCKNSVIKSLRISDNTKRKAITFLSKNEIGNLACKNAVGRLDGLIIIRNFDGTSAWEF